MTEQSHESSPYPVAVFIPDPVSAFIASLGQRCFGRANAPGHTRTPAPAGLALMEREEHPSAPPASCRISNTAPGWSLHLWAVHLRCIAEAKQCSAAELLQVIADVASIEVRGTARGGISACCAAGGSRAGSPGRASSPPSGWVGIAGSSREPLRD